MPARSPLLIRTCEHCSRPVAVGQWVRHRCPACYQYWRRHGAERPLQRSPHEPRLCAVCGQLTREPRRGRCPACYQYWHRHSV